MNYPYQLRIVFCFLVLLVIAPRSFAGSDRLIMTMTPEKMNRMNLVYVKFSAPDGSTLESDKLKQMAIFEQDCNSGKLLELVKDYKIGYAPKNRLVGIYLSPHAWSNKTLCFSIPDIGKIEQHFDATVRDNRSFQLQMAP